MPHKIWIPVGATCFGLGLVAVLVFLMSRDQPTAPMSAGAGRRMVNATDRAAVARDLGRTRDATAIPFLLYYLRDNDPSVRAACALALGQIGERRVAIDLELRLEHEPDASVRVVLKQALDELSVENVARRRAAGVASPDPVARVAAIESLSEFRTDTQTIKTWVGALGDVDPSVRASAMGQLLDVASLAVAHVEEESVTAPASTLVVLIEFLGRTGLIEAVRPLLQIGVARGDERINGVRIRDKVVLAMVDMGNMTVVPMLQVAANQPSFEMVQLMTDVIKQLDRSVGTPAIGELAAQWKEPPTDEELALWLETLDRLGGDATRVVRKRVVQQVAVLREQRELGAISTELECARLAPIGEEIAGAPEDGVFVMVLDNALFGCPLAIHLDRVEGRFRHAFGIAHEYNTTSHHVDAATLRVDGSVVTGHVKVVVGHDGYTPETDAPIEMGYDIKVSIAGSRLSGSYERVVGSSRISGRVIGLLQQRPEPPDPAWFYMDLPQAVWQERGKSYHDRAYLRLTIWSGRAYDGGFSETAWPVNRTSNAWGGHVDDADVVYAGDSLRGRVQAAVTSENLRGSIGLCGVYDIDLEAVVIGRVVAGVYKTTRDERRSRSGRLRGMVLDAVPPALLEGDARLNLTFDDGLGSGQSLRVRWDLRRGTVSPVKLIGRRQETDFVLTGVRVRGRILDGVIAGKALDPESGQWVSCEYRLEATAYHGGVRGEYHGTRDGMPARGHLTGSVYWEASP